MLIIASTNDFEFLTDLENVNKGTYIGDYSQILFNADDNILAEYDNYKESDDFDNSYTFMDFLESKISDYEELPSEAYISNEDLFNLLDEYKYLYDVDSDEYYEVCSNCFIEETYFSYYNGNNHITYNIGISDTVEEFEYCIEEFKTYYYSIYKSLDDDKFYLVKFSCFINDLCEATEISKDEIETRFNLKIK